MEFDLQDYMNNIEEHEYTKWLKESLELNFDIDEYLTEEDTDSDDEEEDETWEDL